MYFWAYFLLQKSSLSQNCSPQLHRNVMLLLSCWIKRWCCWEYSTPTMIMRMPAFCRFVELKAYNSDLCVVESELVQDCFWSTTWVLVECDCFMFNYSYDCICHTMCTYRLIYSKVPGIQLHCSAFRGGTEQKILSWLVSHSSPLFLLTGSSRI